MNASLFVDTNILVYVFERSDLAKSVAAEDLLHGLVSSGTGAISSQVIGEFVWATTRKLSARLPVDQALEYAEEYTRAFEMLPVNELVTREALRVARRYGLQFWDAQVWATARIGGCDVILTEDVPAPKIEGVVYVDPFGGDELRLAEIIREPSLAWGLR